MRTTIILIYIVALLVSGCGTSATAEPGRLQVVASFYPLAFAAEEVAGSRARVKNLTPPGVEPHDLELSPGDVRELREADVVLLLGRDFQPQLHDAVGDEPEVVDVLDTPGLRLLDDGDPHVWLDPQRYARIVSRVGETLDVRARAKLLAARLEALDAEYRDGLARCARRELVTSHAAFVYLADRYRLEQIAITGVSPEAEPTPRELGRVVEQVRESGATTVFVEPLVSPRLAETVARETGVATAVLNPIEGLTAEQARRDDDYFTLMRANLAALRKALGCR